MTARQLAQQQIELTSLQQQQQQQLTTVPVQPRQPGLTAQQLQQQQAALTALQQQQAAQATATPVTSNKTIDTSPLDFNKGPSQPSSLTSTVLDGHNYGDNNIDWYDIVDISAVRINNNFIQEGPSYEPNPLPMVSLISFPHLCNDKLWQIFSDEASDVTHFTFNITNGMSNIDFNDSLTHASSLTSTIVKEKQSPHELNVAPSSEPRHCPVNNQNTNTIIDPSFDPSPFMIICSRDVPGLDPSLGPSNYSSMFSSLFPIRDCGWVYRTNSNYYIRYYQMISYEIYGMNCYYIYEMNS